MGKKSLTKSTSKKKSTKKKTTAKSTSKKSVSENAKTQKNTSQKSGGKKKPTLKSLRKKDFGAWTPDTMYTPEPETANFSAPPVIDTDDKATAKRLKALLAKQFELSEKKKAAPKKTQKKKTATPATKKKAAPKKSQKKKVSIEELLQKRFDAWQPDKPFKPEPEQTAGQFAAPAFADDVDPDKLRELLFREFDLSKVTPKPPPEPEVSAPAEAASEPEKPAEPKPVEVQTEASQPEEAAEPETAEAAAAEEPVEAAPAEQTEPAAETEQPQEPAEPEPEKEKAPEAAAETEKKSAPEAPKAEEKKAAEKPKPQKPEDSPLAKTPGKPSPPPPGGGGSEPPGPPPPSGPQDGREPMGSGLKILIICIAALFACIILASALNSSKYYIKAGKDGAEIWKGDFSPRGKDKVITLNGVEPPEDVNGAVSKQTAYELPFDYYMTRAEKLSEKPGIPDFEAIRKELKKAKKYAITRKQIQRVENRLNHIEFTFLLYKADIAADQDLPAGYDKALDYLEEAKELAVTASQKELVENRIQEINRAMSGSEEGDEASQKPLSPPECPAKSGAAETEKPQPQKNKEKAEQPAADPKTKPDKPSEEEHLM